MEANYLRGIACILHKIGHLIAKCTKNGAIGLSKVDVKITSSYWSMCPCSINVMMTLWKHLHYLTKSCTLGPHFICLNCIKF